VSIASPLTRPSPFCRRVGIRISTFEACSGFTHVTARWIAQPRKAAFVTRLRSSWSVNQTARQLPEQSTTLWVDPPSTGETRPRGALRKSRIMHTAGSVSIQGRHMAPFQQVTKAVVRNHMISRCCGCRPSCGEPCQRGQRPKCDQHRGLADGSWGSRRSPVPSNRMSAIILGPRALRKLT
jgi:hypothetical protein